MKVGFTGTQQGMTDAQKSSLMIYLSVFAPTFYLNLDMEFHHGDCVGADKEFNDIVTEMFGKDSIVIHPPLRWEKRAFCDAREWKEPKEYLDRNHDIVDDTEYLIATPKETKMIQRSGTWATVRYAIKQQQPGTIFWPDGNMERLEKNYDGRSSNGRTL